MKKHFWCVRLASSCGIFCCLVAAMGCMGEMSKDVDVETQEFAEPEPFISERVGDEPSGCWSTLADYERVTGRTIDAFHQSPMLDLRDLPPILERISDEPLIVKPLESIGKYGGTMRILTDKADSVNIRNFMSPATLISFDRDYKNLAPGMVKSWEFNDDGTSLTLYFRKGMRWSDGHPFTMEDVVFWYEDILKNDDLTPVKPAHWAPKGELMGLKAIDDYTVELTFKEPYPGIVNQLVLPNGSQSMFFQCKHYMKQFHPQYADSEELRVKVEESGFESWNQLFRAVEANAGLGDPRRMDCPTMGAYVVVAKNIQTTELERNPYFWKIDPQGNQLPYIDRVSAYFVEGQEVFKLKLMSGQVDFDVGLYTISVSDIPTLKKNEKAGGYRTLLWKVGWSGVIRLGFNLTHAEEFKRSVFNDFRFRKAMSLALDRKTMNDSVLFQRGVPCQASVLPDKRWSKFYVEEYTKAYIEYDPAESNRLLDEMGLDRKDSDGFRLDPDGKRFIMVLMSDRGSGARGSFYELVSEYWADVGIKLIVKPVDGTVKSARLESGDFDLMTWHIDGISDTRFLVNPFPFVPITKATVWGPMWYRWYNSDGAEGEQPPPKVMELYEYLRIMQTTMDEERRVWAGKQILKSQAENLWNIGTVGYYTTPLVANKHLRNVPEVALWTWDYYHTAPLPPEAFYFDNL